MWSEAVGRPENQAAHPEPLLLDKHLQILFDVGKPDRRSDLPEAQRSLHPERQALEWNPSCPAPITPRKEGPKPNRSDDGSSASKSEGPARWPTIPPPNIRKGANLCHVRAPVREKRIRAFDACNHRVRPPEGYQALVGNGVIHDSVGGYQITSELQRDGSSKFDCVASAESGPLPDRSPAPPILLDYTNITPASWVCSRKRYGEGIV